MFIPVDGTSVAVNPTMKVNGKDVVDQKKPTPAPKQAEADMMKEILAQLASLKAENDALKAAKSVSTRQIKLKVSEKGAISAYGIGRFPVTLYAGQWYALLCFVCGLSDEQYWQTVIGKFTIANKSILATKE